MDPGLGNYAQQFFFKESYFHLRCLGKLLKKRLLNKIVVVWCEISHLKNISIFQSSALTRTLVFINHLYR